jgi:hypothetical protein
VKWSNNTAGKLRWTLKKDVDRDSVLPSRGCKAALNT